MDNGKYDTTNNCDIVGNGSLHCTPLLSETKKWHSLEDHRKPLVARGSIRNWFHSLFNGGNNYHSSDISLRKSKPMYIDLPTDKTESMVWECSRIHIFVFCATRFRLAVNELRNGEFSGGSPRCNAIMSCHRFERVIGNAENCCFFFLKKSFWGAPLLIVPLVLTCVEVIDSWIVIFFYPKNFQFYITILEFCFIFFY